MLGSFLEDVPLLRLFDLVCDQGKIDSWKEVFVNGLFDFWVVQENNNELFLFLSM